MTTTMKMNMIPIMTIPFVDVKHLKRGSHLKSHHLSTSEKHRKWMTLFLIMVSVLYNAMYYKQIESKSESSNNMLFEALQKLNLIQI